MVLDFILREAELWSPASLLFYPTGRSTSPISLTYSQKTFPNHKKIKKSPIFFNNVARESKIWHIFVVQTRREKIGCETGSSKFQLLEKDYWERETRCAASLLFFLIKREYVIKLPDS